MGLTGPARRIQVEPVREAPPAPAEPERAPEREPVPAETERERETVGT